MRAGDVVGGRFEIERAIGGGGMGMVYRSADRESGSLAAIKVIRVAGGDSARRFEREAEVLAGIQHPGIVRYLSHGATDEGELYLAMEWLEGEDLASRLAIAELSVVESIAAAIQIAEALGAAHALGVVHRDVKPGNVFLVDWKPDQVKLLDFGVARRAGLTALTASGTVVGTPAYMSPEQVRGRKDVDARADVYSLGGVLYRCLTGQPPFSGETPDELLARILHDTPPRVGSLVPALPRGLDELVARMLDKDPRCRPAGGAEAAAALMGLGETQARRVATAEPAAPSAAGAPLVGRVTELAVLRTAIDEPTARVVLFTGDPGIGKSRLLDEAAAMATARGGVALRGRAFEAEMVRPYGAWIDALRSVRLGTLAPELRADLAPLLPELGSTPAPGGDRNRLFDGVAELLRQLAEAGPMTVVLDDLHWFDDASLALLHYLARDALGRARVLFVCGARPVELHENAAAMRMVRAMAREARLMEMSLQPLDVAEIAELARRIDPHVDAARVHAESGGNPLFAVEVARTLAAGEELLSGSLEDLIGDRLARLHERARELLPWAAALGRGFSLEVLGRATSLSPSELLVAVEELERQRVLRAVEATSGGYDFAHDLIRRAAYAKLSGPRRRLIHLHLAAALDGLPDRDGALAGEVAQHAALGGDAERAVRASAAAAERCQRMFALTEARELVERACKLLPSLQRRTRVPLEVRLLTVRFHYSRRDEVPALIEDLGKLIDDAGAEKLPGEVARTLHLRSTLLVNLGEMEQVHADTIRAAEVVRAAGQSEAVLQLANTGFCLIRIERDVPRARTMLEEARTLAGPDGERIADLEMGLGMLASFDGETNSAVQRLEHGLELARRDEDHWRECLALMRLAEIEIGRRHAARVLELCSALEEVAAKLGEGSETVAAGAYGALARLLDGDGSGSGRIDHAADVVRSVDAKGMLAYVLVSAAEIEVEAGCLAEAQRHAREALAAADAVGRGSDTVLAHVVLARTAADKMEARRHLDAAQREIESGRAVSARALRAFEEARGKEDPWPASS